MSKVIKGKAFMFSANVDTDQIYPGRFLDLTDPEDVGKHAMAGVYPNFVREFAAGDIMVASTNFGCGSSREHAAVALKAVGVGAILADSFGRIFYRNAINLGIPAIVCPGVSKVVQKGDVLSIDLSAGIVTNETTQVTFHVQPMSDYVMKILTSGGIKPMIRKILESKK